MIFQLRTLHRVIKTFSRYFNHPLLNLENTLDNIIDKNIQFYF